MHTIQYCIASPTSFLFCTCTCHIQTIYTPKCAPIRNIILISKHHCSSKKKLSSVFWLSRCRPNDVRVSWINDGQRADSEVLSAGSAQGHIVATVVMDTCLGKHGIVLNLALPAHKRQVWDTGKGQFQQLTSMVVRCWPGWPTWPCRVAESWWWTDSPVCTCHSSSPELGESWCSPWPFSAQTWYK